MTKDRIKLELKIKTNWVLTVFVFVWTIMCIIMIGVLAYGLITTPSRIDDLITIWILLVIAAFMAGDYLRWQLKGQENLVLTDKGIEIYNTGTWFSKRLKLNYFEVESIAVDENPKQSKWVKVWGIGGGRIIIEYLGRKRRFGQNLTIKDAKKMTLKIKTEFEKKNSNANKTYK